MKRCLSILLLLAVWAWAAPSSEGATKVRVSLLVSHEVAQPGDTVTLGLQMIMPPKVHTYWRNPGDAGLPASVEWELPEGLKVGATEWAVPEKLVISKLFAYSYETEVILLMPLAIPANTKPGAIDIKGKADWLECTEELCLPANGAVSARLTIGAQRKESAQAAAFQAARARLPKSDPVLAVKARWEGPAKDESRALLIEWAPKSAPSNPDFFPFEAEGFKIEGATEVLQADSRIVTLRKSVTKQGNWPAKLSGLVLDQTGAGHHEAFAIEAAIENAADPTMAATSAAPGSSAAGGGQVGVSSSASLGTVLLFALLGGLILNFMPCVLPVIALKILSFVNQTREEPGRARQLGLIYAAGVWASFLVIAGLVIGVKSAGGIASWGMQYQNPVFLVGMTALVMLIALNLFGAFEITLGGSALGAAGELASREGKSGAFFNGMLATVLGTSCTAPFLTFAIGYALSQPAWVTVVVFSTMAVGLAAPYVLLTWNPRLMKFLPKPGAWMDSFKKAMGFPMLATALWLFDVTLRHFGAGDAFWLALFLLLLALAAWIYGEFIQRGRRRRSLAFALMVATLALAVGFVLEGKLHWRNPVAASASGPLTNDPGGIAWQKWSPEAVAAARQAGKPVLVDFTAAWCLNCQANKASSIEIEPVRKKLKEIGAVALLGDFTKKDAAIAAELQRFERNAVPLVLVYPADASKAPIVLPAILTPSIVLEALEAAAKGKGS